MRTGFKQWLSFLVFPLTALIVIVTLLHFNGYSEVASAVSFLGTPLVVFVALAYVVFFDSKNRWPGLSWQERMSRMINSDS